jgi:hypothetical protein
MAKTYVRVRNWTKFQHYKHRDPPWIKLHSSLFEDEAFAALPDTSKAHLMGIWLLASRLNNRIPASAAFITKRINATTPVDLKALMDAGFLEACAEEWEACEQPASSTLATCSTETEQSRDRERAETPLPNPPPSGPGAWSAARTKRRRRRESREGADELARYRDRLGGDRGLRPTTAAQKGEWRRALESGRYTLQQLQGSICEGVWSELVAAGRLARDAPWPPPGLAPFDARGSPDEAREPGVEDQADELAGGER